MKTEGFLKNKNRFFGKIAMHTISNKRAIEIDDMHDYRIAEVLINK